MTAKQKNNILKLGFSQNEIPVPLFTELYGYGPFLGRRNRGTRDPLFCRACSFSLGRNRLVLILNDLVTMDPERTDHIRNTLNKKLKIPSANIMVAGSHTHSGPTISKGIGWGELDNEFASNWEKLAIKTAVQAVKDETKVTAFYGKATISHELGYNRVVKNGPLDPEIRYLLFEDEAATPKLILHNHGMHAVVFGQKMLKVSADWPGAVNAEIIRRGLARNSAFIQGAAGNINTNPCCLDEVEGEKTIPDIAQKYVNDLELSLSSKKMLKIDNLKSTIERIELPTREDITPDYLRRTIDDLKSLPTPPNQYTINRMEEMIIFMEQGGNTNIKTGFQVFKIGDFLLYGIGGEVFVELGQKIMKKSPGKFSMVSSLTNDNIRYLPTKETFDAYPNIVPLNGKTGYGYYETQFTCLGRFRAPYKPEIGEFIVNNNLRIAKTMVD